MPRFLRRYIERFKSRAKKRKLQAALDRTYDLFEIDLAKVKTYADRQRIEQDRDFECSEFVDELLRIDSLDLSSRATRCHIDVSDFQAPEEAPYHWTQGQHGALYLHPKSYRQLAKAVEEAEYERAKRNLELKDFWWKLITALAAIAAAVASIWNLARKP